MLSNVFFFLMQMLPSGDWHCPNCTCKFCGMADGSNAEDDTTVSELVTCSLCEKKCMHFFILY